MQTIYIIALLLLILIFFKINRESYGSCQVYTQRINSSLNPSEDIQEILEYTQSENTKCVKPDWSTANEQDFANYATCLNQQGLLTKKLTKVFGASPNS
jgi:hypothetical protein